MTVGLWRVVGRFGLVLLAAAAGAPEAYAQGTASQATASPGTAAAAVPEVAYGQRPAEQTRETLHEILRQYPPTLWEVLRLDPGLLTDAGYLAPYPALAGFLKDHPDIVRNPRFYIGTTGTSWYRETDVSVRKINIVSEMFLGLLVFGGFVVFISLLAWVMKTGIAYRRWLRLTKIHTDVHTKLVDRFTSSEDLLAYVQSPAGRRFLESGPAPSDAPAALSVPFSRILGSLQAGSVVMVLGFGLLYVSRYLRGNADLMEVAPFAFMLGTVATAVGVGFLISAGVAYVFSRRLGLLDSHPAMTGHA
jgi:hypothetical protein